MRKILSSILFIGTLISAPILISGCQSADKVAYNGATAVQVSVETAMSAWGNYCAANNPPAAIRAQVKAAYEKYQAAAVAVVDAEQLIETLTATNAPSTSVSTAQTSQGVASAAASQALSDLVALMATFGVKL